MTRIPFILCQTVILYLRRSSRSKFQITKWVWHPIDPHLFCSMSIGPSIHEIWLFQNVTLTFQVQSRIVGPTSYQLTSISVHVNRPSHTWDMAISKLDLENPRSRSHMMAPTYLTFPIPEIQLFQNLALKIQGQCRGWGLSSGSLISLSVHVNRPFRSWDTNISKFCIENLGSRSCVRSKFKVTKWVWHPFLLFQNLALKSQSHGWGHKVGLTSYWFTSFPCRLAPIYLRYTHFKIWTQKSKVKVTVIGPVLVLTSYWFNTPFVPCQLALPS